MIPGMTGILVEIHPVAVAVTVAALLAAVALLVLHARGQLTVRRLLVAWLAAGYVACVAALTLPLQIRTGDYRNMVPWYEKANFVPLLTIDPPTFVLNIVMTVPLGFLLPFFVRVRGVRQVALIGLAVSATIELTQYASNVLLSSGRTGDVNDLPANTLGAVLGFLALRALTRAPAVARLTAHWGAQPTGPTNFRSAAPTDPATH